MQFSHSSKQDYNLVEGHATKQLPRASPDLRTPLWARPSGHCVAVDIIIRANFCNFCNFFHSFQQLC